MDTSIPPVERRILIINSNSSAVATARICAGLEPYAAATTRLTCVQPAEGPQGIDTLLDVTLAAAETVKLAARYRNQCDGILIACGADPGLDACRQIVSQPVVGIAEAGLLMACTLGYRFTVITTLPSEVPRVEQLVQHYGLTGRLASVRALGRATAELLGDAPINETLIALAQTAIHDDGCEVLVLTGAVMIGHEYDLTARLGIPVLVGLACGLKLVESLVDLGLRTSRAGKYAPVTKRDQLFGYPDLQAVYGRSSSPR